MRYLVFAGAGYYPRGGWYDHRLTTDDLEEAVAHAKSLGTDWWHVVDTIEGVILVEGYA